MELLGLSDTAELTISLPATPSENLTIDMHATSLMVAPPTEQVPAESELSEDWIGLPRLVDLREDSGNEPLISRLWEATEHSLEIDEDWQPVEFEEQPRSVKRWWIAAGAAVIVGITVFIWALSDSNGPSANDLRTAYAEASVDLRARLAEVAPLLKPMTSIDAENGELADGAAVLADLEGVARQAADLATEAPVSGPFRSLDPDFEALRANLKTGAERATELERRLAEVLTYRMLLDRAFVLPPLPYAITPDNIPALGVEISLAVVDTLEAVGQLPVDAAFASHRQRAVNLAERLEVWQVEYLEAVRNDDLEATSDLIEEAETKVAEVRASLKKPLATVQGWAARELDYIRAALDRIDDLLALS